jgi:hypothetical protein
MVTSDIVIAQAKDIAVMFCCGILVQSLYYGKIIWQSYCCRWGSWLIKEIIFWVASAASVSRFLYYCSFGQITFHAAAAFLTGLLLWKKMQCGIINLWAKKEEVDNLRTTARLSISTKRERKGWKKEGQNAPKKKKKCVKPLRKKVEEIRPSEIKDKEGFY